MVEAFPAVSIHLGRCSSLLNGFSNGPMRPTKIEGVFLSGATSRLTEFVLQHQQLNPLISHHITHAQLIRTRSIKFQSYR